MKYQYPEALYLFYTVQESLEDEEEEYIKKKKAKNLQQLGEDVMESMFKTFMYTGNGRIIGDKYNGIKEDFFSWRKSQV